MRIIQAVTNQDKNLAFKADTHIVDFRLIP